jgi:CheY-specific phosphatase CheX
MSPYTAPFVTSLVGNFATMFGCVLTPGTSPHGERSHATRDVTAIVGLAGKADGNIVISSS